MDRIKLVCLVILLVSNFCYAGLRQKVLQGNKHFSKDDFEKALQKYRDAQIDYPESDAIHFNIGDSLYKTKKYEEALKEYEKSTYSKNPDLQEKAYYNMGNSMYRTGKLAESILYYKKALEINPDDEDAKYNIEFVRKKIKEQMDQQDKQQQEGQQQQQQQQQQQAQEQGEEKQDKQEKQAQEQGEEKEEQAQKKEEKKEGEMSKEDAERILNAFEDKEKEAQKKRKMQAPPGISVEYDW